MSDSVPRSLLAIGLYESKEEGSESLFKKRQDSYADKPGNLVKPYLALLCVLCTVGELSTSTSLPQFVTKIERHMRKFPSDSWPISSSLDLIIL